MARKPRGLARLEDILGSLHPGFALAVLAMRKGPGRLRVGRRLVLYVNDATKLIDQIRRHDEGDRRPIIVRPTNLEDVFLSLTGASLEANP